MKKRKSGGMKQHKSGKGNRNIALLGIALMIAAGTALLGFLKHKSKKTAVNTSKKNENIDAPIDSSVPQKQNPSRLEHRKINPGELDWETLAREKEAEQIRKGEIPEYMLVNTKKPKCGGQRKKWKLAASSVAMLLVVTVVSYSVVQRLNPSEVMAKESFTGIGKIVEEHGTDNPYQILNIVPSRVEIAASGLGGSTGSGGAVTPDPDNPVLTSFNFTTGTIGYLAGGSVPFADELVNAFTGNPIFQHYESREDLVNLLIPESSIDTFPEIQYREAYGGVHNISLTDGWMFLFESQQITVDDAYNNTSGIAVTAMTSGGFHGSFVQYIDGENKTGYDFIYNSGTKSANNITGLTGRFVYVFDDPDNDGEGTFYAVSLEEYANMEEGTVAFKVAGSTEFNGFSGFDSSVENDAVYTYDENDGRYVYQGTIGEVFKDYRDGITDSDDSDSDSNNDNNNNDDSNNGNGASDSDSETSGGDSGDNSLETPDDNTGDSSNNPPETPGGNTGDSGDDSPETPGDNSGGSGNDSSDTFGDNTGDSGDNSHDTSGDEQTQAPSDTAGPSADEVSMDTASLDRSSNPIFTSSWRRLVKENDGSGDEPNPSDTGSTGTDETPTPDTGSTGTGEAPTPDTGNTGSNNTPTPGTGNTGTDETPTPDTGNTGSNNTPAPDTGNTGSDETPTPGTGSTDSDDTPEAEEPAEDNGESGKKYYVLTFEPLSTDELSALETADDLEDVTLDEESGGISLFAASPNYDSTFIYVGPGQGNYKLTATGDDNDKLIGVYNAPIYFRCQAGNDWLRRYVFNSLSGGDNANSSFKVEVTTVRADEVTADMVYKADLVYMESGQNLFLSPGLDVSYIQPVEDDPTSDESEETDMSEVVVDAILSRAAEDLMPIIVDYAIAEDTENYADTNYQLLAKALLKRDLAGYFEAVDDGANLMDNIAMTVKADKYPDKDDNNYNYVNQNVYIVNDDTMLVSTDFAEFFDDFKAKAGFGDVLAAIVAENTTLSEEDKIKPAVSKARAIQYIINFSVGIMGEFDDLTILELQPTANTVSGKTPSDLHIEVDSKDNTKLYWKTESMKTGKQILYSKKPFEVKTDVKSVVEFNGEWNDINGTYDMIFIGLDGRNLNLSSDKPRRPVYNNSDLNGKVYHTGDSAGNGTYDSNDITSQKMMDLLEYLQAGYPIVVENDCFKDKTARGVSDDSINTKYIDEDSMMYRFLSAAVSDEKYRESIFTVSDTMSSASFMARMKTSKPRIELINEDNPDAGQDSESSDMAIVQQLALDENDEYHGRIAYEIKNDRGEEYLGSTTMHLYADMNYDGIFGAEEELSEYANEGNLIDVVISGMGPGIVPWKLEVTDTGNEYRRHSVQGYFELRSSYEEEVRVLHVTTAKGDKFADLKEVYNKKEDSMLAYYLRGAEGTANLSFEFESVTPDMLQTRLAENNQYLNQWDVIVLTIDEGVAVDTAVFEAYINEGRSLLVCSQNKNVNGTGLTSEMLGWSEGRTFVSLGASNLHRYAGLHGDMYAAQNGNLKAEKINEGSILYYPYQLEGSSFACGNTPSGLRASEYLLDFEDNLKSNPTQAYVTAWLTLGGDKQTAYGLSPRDARNNYYCYSKGNVVYLAQSEYYYTYDVKNNEIPDGKEGSDECKFFVNALMAAYGAGIHGSDVSIVSGFAQTSTPLKSISVPFDQEWKNTADDNTEGILDNTVDVYFKFADSNIGANKNVTVSFYYEDPAGEKVFVVDDKQVTATQFGSEINTVTNNKLVPVIANDPQNPGQVNLVPGKVYQIKAPVVSLRMLADDTTNNAGIYVLVESEFTRTGKTYKIEGLGTVSLNRAKLFLLE